MFFPQNKASNTKQNKTHSQRVPSRHTPTSTALTLDADVALKANGVGYKGPFDVGRMGLFVWIVLSGAMWATASGPFGIRSSGCRKIRRRCVVLAPNSSQHAHLKMLGSRPAAEWEEDFRTRRRAVGGRRRARGGRIGGKAAGGQHSREKAPCGHEPSAEWRSWVKMYPSL